MNVLVVDLFIILEMVQEEIHTSCIILCYNSSDEGGIAKSGAGSKKFNFLASLRAPITRNTCKADDILMKTQDSWKSRGTSERSGYQRNLDRRLSTHRQYEDPYHKMRSTFRSSVGFK